MLIEVITFLPFITCLFWLVLNPLLNKDSKGFGTLELLLALSGTVSLSQAGILLGKGNMIPAFFLAKQFFTPLLIPAMLMYVSKLTPGMTVKPAILVWIAIPISLLFAESILIMLSGTEIITNVLNNIPAQGEYDKAVTIIRFCSFTVFYSILAIQVLIWAVYTIKRISGGNLNRHIHYCTAYILILIALEIIIQTHSMAATWLLAALSIMLSVAIFGLSYAGMFQVKTDIVMPETKPEPKTATDKPLVSGNIIVDVHQSQIEEEDLRIRFEDLIVTEQLFLKQGIRISDIATMLDTNRTYVSRLVNNTYNMSFSDYINTLRIDYAEQYLIHHREAKQSDIAAACGFPNASAFNNVFKKITGVTPKIWLATRSGQSE